jgi:regulator of protease activity HflC (stomatin/prohibitin superfamily)
MFQYISGTFIIAIIIVVFFLMSAIKILNEFERGVIFRLGRALPQPKGPGLIILIPLVDRLIKVNLQLVTYDVPSQDIITRDNVTMKVNAVVYFRVIDPLRAIIEVRDYYNATQLLAQTTLRSVCGQVDLDDLLSAREKVNAQLAEILDQHTDPWGIKVTLVELRAIDLPIEMQRAMAKQAEAERERRGKVINAEGEFQAAAKMADAARVLAAEPMSLTLRYLQTLREIAAEKNSTTLFPIPIDLLAPFMKMANRMEKLEEDKG